MTKIVRIGAKGFKIAQLNDKGLVVGDPLEIPGTTQADISISSENTTIAADDGAYMALSSGITKVTLKLSNYFLPPEAKKILFGTKFGAGMETYGSDTVPNHVAVIFQTQLKSNETHPLYIGLLNGVFKFPDSKNKTKGLGAPDPATEEIEGEFVMQQRGKTNTILVNGFSSKEDFDLTTFENYVMPKTDELLQAAIQKYESAAK